MKLQFDPNQQYQLDAIDAIVNVFEGQPLQESGFGFSLHEAASLFHEEGAGNRLAIDEAQILKNVRAVQARNGLPVSERLDGLPGETAGGSPSGAGHEPVSPGMHFSVEMETGTGKTYVYLRTIYELHKKYGFTKFVIVVPSVAIREGVLKNLEITHAHFQNLYDKTPASYSVYDAKRVSSLRNFALSNAVQILVMNIDAFAKDENIINKPNDRLTGRRPVEFVQAVRPIVIVDEPQNMETDIRRRAIDNLRPLCTLRYSATHITRYNMVYSLDPVQAYDLGLVKQIEVDSVVTENDFNDAYVSLEKVTATKTRTAAKIRIDVNTKDGVKRKTVTAKVGDDLYALSNRREIYRHGCIVNGIDVAEGFIELSNGEILFAGDALGSFGDEIMRMQIRKTVEEHFLKERKLKDRGVKVLSLFFIDRVANYRGHTDDGAPVKGKLAQWFEEAYREMAAKAAFRNLLPFAAEQVHNGYFSQDRKGAWKDTRGNTQADDDTFKLIMKDKERLLDVREPLRFIFSHSALREGWDNPNVFQICTLNETQSELKKRQEIGRGMRLAVDQNGARIFDKGLNRLTVIANESYEDFARQLQTEIEQDCGVCFAGRIKNKQRRATVQYRKGFALDAQFKAIWERIKHKTIYRVQYATEDLIRQAAKAVAAMPAVKKAMIKTTKSEVRFDRTGVVSEVRASSASVLDGVFPIPDVLFYIQERTELTRATIAAILQQSGQLGEVLLNPQLFLDYAVAAIREALAGLMVDGIEYEKIGGQEYEMRLFKEVDAHIDALTFHISKQEKTIYSDLMPLDSKVEYEFARECEARDDIAFYFKLPFWFKIETPVGYYNPGWALIKKNERTVYFVAETKSAGQELRPSEKRKIACGRAHFREFDAVEFRQVARVGDLDG